MRHAKNCFLAVILIIRAFSTIALAQSTIAQGEFIEKEKSLSGSWSIEQSEGGRRYQIPEEVDFPQYKSLLIHREKCAALWGGGALCYKRYTL